MQSVERRRDCQLHIDCHIERINPSAGMQRTCASRHWSTHAPKRPGRFLCKFCRDGSLTGDQEKQHDQSDENIRQIRVNAAGLNGPHPGGEPQDEVLKRGI